MTGPTATIPAKPCRPWLVAAGAALILLGGCSRSAPEPAEVNETSTAAPAVPAPVPEPAAPAPAPKPEKTARAEVPPAEEPPPEVQMQDDADATGMTAHVSHDDAADNVDAPPDPAKGD